jgi:hypothetical protein
VSATHDLRVFEVGTAGLNSLLDLCLSRNLCVDLGLLFFWREQPIGIRPSLFKGDVGSFPPRVSLDDDGVLDMIQQPVDGFESGPRDNVEGLGFSSVRSRV